MYMNYKKLIAVTIALTVCAFAGSNVTAHGGGGGGGHGGGFGGGGGFRGGDFYGGFCGDGFCGGGVHGAFEGGGLFWAARSFGGLSRGAGLRSAVSTMVFALLAS